jgi:phosphatidylserine synthase
MTNTIHQLISSARQYFSYRHRFGAIPGFLQAYGEEMHTLTIIRTRALTVVGIMLYLSFHILDRLLYPEMANFFLMIRIVLVVAALLCLISTFLNWTRRHIQIIFFCAIFCADLGISWMSAFIGGWSSVQKFGRFVLH